MAIKFENTPPPAADLAKEIAPVKTAVPNLPSFDREELKARVQQEFTKVKDIKAAQKDTLADLTDSALETAAEKSQPMNSAAVIQAQIDGDLASSKQSIDSVQQNVRKLSVGLSNAEAFATLSDELAKNPNSEKSQALLDQATKDLKAKGDLNTNEQTGKLLDSVKSLAASGATEAASKVALQAADQVLGDAIKGHKERASGITDNLQAQTDRLESSANTSGKIATAAATVENVGRGAAAYAGYQVGKVTGSGTVGAGVGVATFDSMVAGVSVATGVQTAEEAGTKLAGQLKTTAVVTGIALGAELVVGAVGAGAALGTAGTQTAGAVVGTTAKTITDTVLDPESRSLSGVGRSLASNVASEAINFVTHTRAGESLSTFKQVARTGAKVAAATSADALSDPDVLELGDIASSLAENSLGEVRKGAAATKTAKSTKA